MSRQVTDREVVRLAVAADAVWRELEAAMVAHKPFASAHEGYAVLLEEVDELWDEVKRKPRKRDPARMRAEACQVAAMAIRFMADVCGGES